MSAKPTCPECGPAPVNHFLYRVLVIANWIYEPFIHLFEIIDYYFSPITHFISKYGAILFIKITTTLRLTTITTAVDDQDNLRTKALWESAKKKGIEMKEFRFLGRPAASLFQAQFKNKTFYFDALPVPPGTSIKSLSWIDDKSVMKEYFKAAGIPVAQGGSAITFARAQKIFKEIGGTVIVKPRTGSRSRHTYININSVEGLKRAFKSAKKLSPWVMIEQELVGPVYRGTVIGGDVVGVIRRDPACVIGDGVSSIQALIEKENKNPQRQGPIFHEIPIDADAHKELTRQNVTLESIPEKNKYITVNQKVSRGCGASTTDVTNITHPDNTELLKKVAKVLETSLVGVDFIIEDISKSWKDQKNCGVIECNSMPYIDLHHYPLYGTPRDVAGILWDKVLS